MGNLRGVLRARSRVSRVAFTVGVGFVIAVLGVGVSGGIVAQSSPPNPLPTVTVMPNTNLHDLQQVTVVATGFTPGVTVGTVECRNGAVGESDCDLSTLFYATADSTGAFTLKR